MYKGILIVGCALSLAACGGGGSDSSVGDGNSNSICDQLNTNDFNCSTMLTDLVEQGVRPLVADFKTQLTQLNTATNTYCSDIDDQLNLTAAEDAWLAVMATVAQLQAMQFGPSANADAGLSAFYAGSGASPLSIDIAIAANAQSSAGLSGINNRQELIALEYILFSPGTITNTTSANQDLQNWITATNSDDTAIQNDRCDYAKRVTENLAANAVTFENSWSTYTLSSSATSSQVAANEVTDAMFFADKQIKDAKVKEALPQSSTGQFDALKLESQFANVSKEHLINNLVGLKRIFTANDSGQGLDDYLVAIDESDLASEMVAQIDAAIANLNAIEGTLSDAVTTGTTFSACSALANNESNATDLSDIEELCKFQYTIKQFTDTLKGEFILATRFVTPANASGDND